MLRNKLEAAVQARRSRNLRLAVLAQALHDYKNGSAAIKEEVAEWLDSDGFIFDCEAADLNPKQVLLLFM